jgi:DNA-binding beta-propeller fold protein YncE
MLLLLACFPELKPPSGLTDNPNVDYDGDGYTVAEGDCDDADPERYPGFCDTGIEGDTDSDTDGDTDTDTDADTDVGLNAEHLYFAELHLDAVYRTNLSTKETVALVSGLSDPVGVAVDRKNGWLYWADGSEVRRAPLTGGASETVASGLGTLREVAVDATLERVCWSTTSAVQCKNFAGETVLDHTTSGSPVGVALDSGNNHIWWAEVDHGTIQRANLDGSEATEVFSGLTSPSGIDLDRENGRVFWTEQSTRIAMGPMDGSEVVDLVTVDLNGNAGVAWDAGDDGWVYFSNNGFNQIERVRVDGSGREAFVGTDLVSGLNEPRHVTLDGFVP